MRHVRHAFAWLGGITFIVICLVVVAGFVVRTRMVPQLERNIFVTHSPSTDTPQTYGAPYHIVSIDSHGRSLQAWTVDAGADTPALLLFHGNGQTIHDFAQVQAYLFHHHVSSMSFDYSGFGASTGKPTIQNLNQDAKAAWGAFARWAGSARPKFVIGYSLGTGAVLHNVDAFVPQPLGVVVYGAFSSAKKLVQYISPRMPVWLVTIMPDLWDNVEAAQTLREPLLVLAGMDDTNVPPSMGRRIALFAEAGNSHSAFVLIPDVGHGGIVDHIGSVWPSILAFVHKLTAPEIKQSTQPVIPAPSTDPMSSTPATDN
ncbi:MAG: alpha/beta hydrolase [Rhodanobacteraceae bacterium]|nr:MAG: alpha/beta hydrolase [Rhodanobacteraceae bacterium]